MILKHGTSIIADYCREGNMNIMKLKKLKKKRRTQIYRVNLKN